jgi:hypothetical protein
MKKAITTFALAAIMTLGTTFANGGIIVAGRADESPSTCKTQSEGIIVAGFAGIIVAGFAGIIVAGSADPESRVCSQTEKQSEGIIVAGRDGIIVAG